MNIVHHQDLVSTGSPDTTVPSPPQSAIQAAAAIAALRVKQHFQNPELSPCNVAELAELTSTEISLDLQGLIDDSHFGDDNLFGDLIDNGKKSDGSYRTSPTHSLGSSGQSSPGGGQESPPNFQYRNLAYLPGSVHGGAAFGNHMQQQQQHQQQMPIVKQEPVENEFGNHFGGRGNTRGGLLAPINNVPPNSNNNQQNISNSNQQYSNSTVSSTTNAMAAFVMNGSMNNGAGIVAGAGMTSSGQTPLPSLKSFAVPPRYLQAHTTNGSSGSKKRMDRNSDEYRKRRERNNVAVRKSREKAKLRSKDTEERVKILARENERLQKKVELLQEELSVLRSLFSNVGVLPEHIHRELAKHMDNFQQQHNAMGCM
jgi:CCAAT/enhancer binding protein (C/EBP)